MDLYTKSVFVLMRLTADIFTHNHTKCGNDRKHRTSIYSPDRNDLNSYTCFDLQSLFNP